MRVERAAERGSPQIVIRDLEGDMGETTRMDVLVQEDGDVILSLKDPEKRQVLEIEFCTFSGGGRNPQITKKLRELAQLIANDYERGEIVQPDEII